MELYTGKDVESVVDEKSKEKQVRAFAGDSSPVPLTVDECKKLCKATNNLEYHPGYEDRVRVYTITDESADRYGDIVRAKGCMLDNYLKNPVVQFAHDYSLPPIGNAIKIWKDKATNSVKAWALFFGNEVDSSGRSDLIFRFIKANAMRGSSIGFQPLSCNRPKTEDERKKLGLGEYGVEFLEWDLLEFSAVPVPANPNALKDEYRPTFLRSIRSGLFTTDDVKFLRKEPFIGEHLMDELIKEIDGGSRVVVDIELKEKVNKIESVVDEIKTLVTDAAQKALAAGKGEEIKSLYDQCMRIK